jgi:hypothetical protein
MSVTIRPYRRGGWAAHDGAIRRLERPGCVKFRGEIVETGDRENAKSNG